MDFWAKNSIYRWIWRAKQKNHVWTEWKRNDKFTRVFLKQLILLRKCFG